MCDLALQYLVNKGNRSIKIPEKVAYATLKRVGHDLVIAHRDWSHDFIQSVVKGVYLAVKTFPRIPLRVCMAVLRTRTAC